MAAGCCFAAEIECSPNGKRPPRAASAWAVSAASGGKALGCGMVMVLDLVLVPAHLSIELVHQLIDRGVQVFV